MELTVDIDSPIPAYEQIRAQVTEMVESGSLSPKAPLPSVRQLAADLQIAPGTVGRAYRELESSGVVVCSRWEGTRVADVQRLDRGERKRRLDHAVARMTAAARRLGASNGEIESAVARALKTSTESR